MLETYLKQVALAYICKALGSIPKTAKKKKNIMKELLELKPEVKANLQYSAQK